MSTKGKTKIEPCLSCGKEVTVSLFMSGLKVRCDHCKSHDIPADPERLAEAEKKASEKKKRSKAPVNPTSGSKEVECSECGEKFLTHRFGKVQGALCPKCRPTSEAKTSSIKVKVDINRLSKKMIPIEDFAINPVIIANPNLQYIQCPNCQKKMTPLTIMDTNKYGCVMQLQCPHCLITMSLSEQTKHLIKPTNANLSFTYTGEAMRGISNKKETIEENCIGILLDLLDDNNIEVPEAVLPKWYRKIDFDLHLKRKGEDIGITDQQTLNLELQQKIKDIEEELQETKEAHKDATTF